MAGPSRHLLHFTLAKQRRRRVLHLPHPQAHPSVLPFLVFIKSEAKHVERMAVRLPLPAGPLLALSAYEAAGATAVVPWLLLGRWGARCLAPVPSDAAVLLAGASLCQRAAARCRAGAQASRLKPWAARATPLDALMH